MGGDPALTAERKHHLRSKAAQLQNHVAHHAVQVLAMQVTIGIIQHDAAADPQNLTRSGKLLAAHVGQFVIVLGAAAMGRRLAGSQAQTRKSPRHDRHRAVMFRRILRLRRRDEP